VTADEGRLRAWLSDKVSAALPGGGKPDEHRPLTELGLSSARLVGLLGELGDLVGADIPVTLVWERPTIAALAAAIAGGDQGAGTATRRGGTSAGGGVTPIAVIGLGCRLPGGVEGPAGFWEFLEAGRDGVTELPPGRWADFVAGGGNAALAADLPRRGGFLTDVEGFDAEYFGIAPREAALMDPQQRIFLEVATAAVHHAGLTVDALRGSRTGVFAGVSASEYSQLTVADLAGVEAWTGTGAAISVIANRLSYLWDLRGPSMTIDTACSSSLVAVHQASRALRDGEIDTAVVGGVNLLLGPAITASFQAAGALSADGRCKAFDAAADGIVRGEGCGVVVLQRLPEARRAGARVLAVIRSSAVNSDGRSNGLMAPNPAAQEELLRDAYAGAGLEPSTVDYIEAHGTGTLLGDPIEAGALGRVLGQSRPEGRPLLLGSVKTNLGHLEGAAGIAGLIKVVLAMAHRRLPASLHYQRPNPHIRFAEHRLEVVAEPRNWPRYSGAATAGVSSFGFGGTNAHVILEEFPQVVPVAGARRMTMLALSGAAPDRVRQHAGALADWLSSATGAASRLGDVAHTLSRRREPGRALAAVVGRDHPELAAGLRALARGDREGVHTGQTANRPGPVWVFSGFGSQWPGMARRLLDSEPAFASTVDELDPLFAAKAGFSLRSAIVDGELAGVRRTQLVLYGVQLGLAALWRASGVTPGAVIGHSMGEVTAAVAAGALDAATGLDIMAARAGLLEGTTLDNAGGMAVVELTEAEHAGLAQRFPDVEIAVHFSPTQCTVAGPRAQVVALVEEVADKGKLARLLDVGGAGHTATVDPLVRPLRTALSTVEAGIPEIPFYSTVLDDPRSTPGFGADYWAANLRRAVRFQQAVSAATEDGFRVFVEISPHPIATIGITDSARHAGAEDAVVVSTLRRDTDDDLTFQHNLAALYVAGLTGIDAARRPKGQLVELPPPVWQHRRHWVAPAFRRAGAGTHPLLGAYVPAPEGDRHLWHADVGTGALPWLADHSVHGVGVLPGTAYLEMAVAAAAQALDVAPNRITVRDLVFEQVLPLEERTPVTVSLTSGIEETRVEVFGRAVSREWVRHASATVEVTGGGPTGPTPPAPRSLPELTRDLRETDVYQEFRKIGQEYGPAFRGVATAAATAGRAVGEVVLPEPARAGGGRAFTLHPALTDACLHLLAAAVASAEPGARRAGLQLPVGIDSVRVYGTLPAAVRCVATVDTVDADTLRGMVDVLDEDGRTLAQLSGVRVRGIDAGEVPTPLSDKIFERRWEKNDPARGHGALCQGSWLLLTDFAGDQPWVGRLAGRLTAAGHRVSEVHRPDTDALLAAVSELDDAGTPLHGVLLPSAIRPPEDQHADDDLTTAEHLVFRTADVLRTLADRPGDTPRIWTLTRGAAAVADGERGDPTSACLRGLVRVLGYEHPLTRATTVDLDPDPALDPDRLAESAVDELLLDAPDDEVALRGGTRYTARVARTTLSPARESTRPVVRAGSYVITGGLGGLGLLVADWLAARGAARVVLAGRSAPGQEVRAELDRMRERTEVVVVNCDIGEPGAAESLVRAATEGGVTMHGLVHAAGLLADTAVADLDPADLHRVWWPKVWGGRRLHEATKHLDLDWWVVFSSAAALFGSPGQASYATANAWLDALAGWRRAAGLPATTINWGAWAEVGGARDTTNPLLRPITPAEGLAALEAALDAELGDLAVTGLDIGTVLELFPELRRRPFYAALTAETTVPGAATGDEEWPGAEGLAELDPAAARDLVGRQLVARLAAIMGFSVDAIPRDEPLTGLGLDSLMAMRARNAVEGDFGTSLPIPMLLRGATLRDLERHLAGELGLGAGEAAKPGEIERGGLAPRDATERWIARVWREVTGGRTPSVHERLLDPDRDRELAERLARNLGDTLGAELTAEELFAEPTVERLADQLRERFESDDGGPVRRLRPTGTRHPLFLFHPAGGPTSVYQPLIDRLTGDLPCYGFERIDDVRSLEDKAERYVRMIREIQPAGPYHLAGWSFGGMLGFECAQQLTAAGEEVALLAMIDTILPKRADDGTDQNGGGDLILRYRRFVDHIERAYGTPLEVPWDKLALLAEDEQFDLVMELISKPEVGIGAGVLRHQYTSYVDARVGERYRPRPYDGPVVLYRAREGHRLTTSLDPRYDRSDEALGWDEYCRGLEVVYVPGDHVSMIDPPHIHVVADHLTGLLGAGE
jgi:phthiocerol/phenolphthiocerol synthesis type-I polyketide synthase D